MKTCAFFILFAAGSLPAQQSASSVSFDRILHASGEPQNWLTYSGTTFGQRHSLLTQITPDNVDKLELQWVFQAKSLEKFEATPLVVNGVLYTVQPPTTCSRWTPPPGAFSGLTPIIRSPKSRTCCGRVNRGLAILGDTLFMGTIDAHLLALDAKTGQVLWNTTVADVNEFYSITHAPLVVKDKVIVGTAGGDIGIGGIIAAFDARTGKEVWRFHTIPQPGEPGHETWAGDSWKHGGAAIWNTGSYDPETNLTFWGTGNPGAGLGRPHALGRQSVQRFGGRAGCRHRQAEMVLPIHAARRNGLRLDAGARAGRHGLARRAAQSNVVGQSQRPDVRAGSQHRPIPDGQAVRHT